ncbi:transposable element Tc1 transposase [Trichonephila clavipes]|nr:transposable element Tc1 transposase [Trichonephila clavipes]
MPRRSIRAHYEQLSEFEIELKEGARIDRYATCKSRLHTVKPDYSGTRLEQVGIVLTGRIVFRDETHLKLCHDEHRRRVWRRPVQRTDPAFTIAGHTGPQQGVMYPGLIFQQDKTRSHTARVAINCLTAYQTLLWPSKSSDPSPIEHVQYMMRRRLHLPGNVDDLARQLEKIWQEIPQETIRVLYYSMSCRVAACIQARGGSTPY